RRPKSATSITSRSAAVSTMPASASIAAARSRACSTSASVVTPLERDRLARLGRAVQPPERPRLRDGILAAEEQLRLAADRTAQVLQLEPVRVGGLQPA